MVSVTVGVNKDDQRTVLGPKLGKLIGEAENNVLAFWTFPRVHWKQIYSTDPLERLNAEIKRRTRVVKRSSSPMRGARLMRNGRHRGGSRRSASGPAQREACAASFSCSMRHITLPLPLLGSASANSTRRGTL